MPKYNPTATQTRLKGTKTETETKDAVDPNVPLEYLGSRAEQLKAKDARTGGSRAEMPWYQPYVINGSCAIFLIYFCILREESDIDLKLSGDLSQQIPDIEVVQLLRVYNYNLQNNLPNDEIIKRLRELRHPAASKLLPLR